VSDDDEPALSAQDEELVRRTLGASGPDPAMPDDVTRRLDDVLAGLVAERSAAPAAGRAGAPARERARRWPGVLVAAAVLSVVALGVGTLLRGGTGSGADSMGAADAPAGAMAEKAAPDSSAQDSTTSRLPRLHRDSLQADVERFLAVRALRARLQPGGGQAALQGPTARAWCVTPVTTKDDRLVAVRLDRERATLVLRKPRDGVRAAAVYLCGEPGEPAASTTVRTR
jgi:hypothetical protein